MPKYLTWESARNRWIFQIRIPVHARSAFGGRTTIRQHLGNIPQHEAVAHAMRLASQYKEVFRNTQAPIIDEENAPTVTHSKLSFFLNQDMEIGERFIQTWRTWQVSRFDKRIQELRKKPRKVWKMEEISIINRLKSAQDDLRYLNPQPLQTAIAMVENRLNCSSSDLI